MKKAWITKSRDCDCDAITATLQKICRPADPVDGWVGNSCFDIKPVVHCVPEELVSNLPPERKSTFVDGLIEKSKSGCERHTSGTAGQDFHMYLLNQKLEAF